MGIEKKGGYEIQRQREMVTVQKSRGVARRVRGRSGHVKATARRVMLASSTQEAAGSTRRALLSGVGVAASLSILPFFSGEARAGLLDDLLERSAANKEANDKHRQRSMPTWRGRAQSQTRHAPSRRTSSAAKTTRRWLRSSSSRMISRANAQTRQTARCAGAKSRTPFHLSLASNS